MEIREKEYVKATIHTTTQGAEALAAVLPALGIESCCVEDPADLDFIVASKDALSWDLVGVPPEPVTESGEARVTFWIEKGRNPDTAGPVLSELRAVLLKLKGDEQYGLYGEAADFGRLWLDTEIVRDDWKDRYKDTFRSFSPCDGVIVVPPWETVGNSATSIDDVLRIVISPGMAFGTGSHETTRMCLARLKALVKPGDIILDAGTGSGILAIAAAMLGAGHIYAIEIDPDAAASAAGNFAANGVAGIITMTEGDIAAPGTLPPCVRYDVITANLTCSLLEKLLPSFKGILTDEGALVLSGLLEEQERRALKALNSVGMEATAIVKDGEWLMIEACK